MKENKLYTAEMVVLHNRIVGYCSNGNYSKALQYSIDLLKIFEVKCLSSTYDYASELFTAAYIFEKLARYSESLNFYKKSRDVLAEAAPKSPLYADALNNIGIILAERGKADAALKSLNRASLCYSRLYGKESCQYADVLSNIGTVQFIRGAYLNATMVYAESMKAYQSKNITIVDIMCRIGHTFEKMTNGMKALICFEDALLLAQRSDFAGYRDKFAIKLYIAHIRYKNGDMDIAANLYSELQEEIADTIGVQNMQYVESLNMLSKIYTQKDAKRAIQYKYAALKALEKITSKSHFYYGTLLKELAELLKNNDDADAAMALISDYIEQTEAGGNIDTDDYVKTAAIRADILRRQGKPKEAVKLLEKVVFNCSGTRKDYMKCLLMLVHLYLEYGCGNNLYGVYDRFVQVKPGNSFDDMLDMSEEY